MKQKIKSSIFAAVAVLGVLAVGGCANQSAVPPTENVAAPAITSPPTMASKNKAATPAKIPAGAQKVTVELPDGYKNGAAIVKAGTPVALTFKLTKDAGCGNEISVPAANWQKDLKVGESATVVYTPKKSGELKFACSMDHMRGTLIVK